jgi:RNA polymerase sigma-70 factor (ECF subfamily)
MVGAVIWRATNNEGAVEDLGQETFLRVFRALEYFDARARLSTWIYTIAHRVAIDHLRKTGRWREMLIDTEAENGADSFEVFASTDLDPEAALSRNETKRLVREGLAQLPEKYRLAIVYAAIDGLDYPTIAAMLGMPVGTIKTFVFRGKRMLKDYITRALGKARVSDKSDGM